MKQMTISLGCMGGKSAVLWWSYLLIFIASSLCQAFSQYEITWYTIDGGGGTSTGGPYTLTGTIGQPDAGWSIGGIYELLGGFWLGGPLPECYTGPNYDQWLDVGSPACWCASVNLRQCHGDADGKSQGKNKYWVSTEDLDILIAAWNKSFEQLAGNQICADFDHLPQGKSKYRVSTEDLDILVANWNTANKPDPDCP